MTDQLVDLDQLTAEQRVAVAAEFDRLREVSSGGALTVAVMGQTGVGKSSLLNALFDVSLQVGDVRPTTMEPLPVEVRGPSGRPLVFWDMPGIGESAAADARYLELYRRRLLDSDVVLWALHADIRSTTTD